MKKYEDMSDFEINVMVAKRLGMKVKTEFEENRGFTERYHKQYPNTIWAAKCDESGNQIDAWEQVIFTACPNDIMPIAIENGISLNRSALTMSGYIWQSNANNNHKFQCRDKNPYRAIAICFLKIKDAKNE